MRKVQSRREFFLIIFDTMKVNHEEESRMETSFAVILSGFHARRRKTVGRRQTFDGERVTPAVSVVNSWEEKSLKIII